MVTISCKEGAGLDRLWYPKLNGRYLCLSLDLGLFTHRFKSHEQHGHERDASFQRHVPSSWKAAIEAARDYNSGRLTLFDGRVMLENIDREKWTSRQAGKGICPNGTAFFSRG